MEQEQTARKGREFINKDQSARKGFGDVRKDANRSNQPYSIREKRAPGELAQTGAIEWSKSLEKAFKQVTKRSRTRFCENPEQRGS